MAAIECKMKVDGEVEAERTLSAYVSSPITVEPWGIRIEQHQKDTARWDE